ncbi:MAG: hypothetical protein OER77_08705 [Myxococcales bacterium]|nr:hypothetical protein [Myxococcales bacterium]
MPTTTPPQEVRHVDLDCGGVAFLFVGGHAPAEGDILYAEDVRHVDGRPGAVDELIACDTCGRLVRIGVRDTGDLYAFL